MNAEPGPAESAAQDTESRRAEDPAASTPRFEVLIQRVWNALAEWSASRSRLLVLLGLAACLLTTVYHEWDTVRCDDRCVRQELTKKEDIHNLYFAASRASWTDAPHWWVGSWIYPDVGYYRPLTSMLYLAEYRAFHSDFTRWNQVSLVLHVANVGLVYLLAISLFRRHHRSRALIGLVAAHYFATADGSMYFAVQRILSWWPAQNDSLSLTFGLLSLLLLDQYLDRRRWGWLAAALLSLFLSMAAKEMGFMVAPAGLVLIAQRRLQSPGPWKSAVSGFTALTAFMWFFRRLVIPHHWGPALFRRVILERLLTTWLGPGALFAYAGIWWPAVASALIVVLGVIGLRRRWPVARIVALSVLVACLTIQILVPDGTFAILLFWPDQCRLFSALGYLLAGLLFVRYVREEPALATGLALWLVYLPILQYGGGRHYYYWPAAFNAVADAAFAVCLVRGAIEMKPSANWELRPPFARRAAASERENAAVS